MHTRHRAAVAALAAAPATILIAEAFAGENLLRNPGFEDVPEQVQGQGLMPSEWLLAVSTPDTYSVDGTYGLLPGAFGNFPGVAAHQGVRWIAGASSFLEVPAQELTETLVVGRTYVISAWLHQALRPDLNFPGAYEIRLASTPAIQDSTVVAVWAPTTTGAGWEHRSAEFVAPPESASLPYLLLVPYAADAGSAYAGIDDIELVGPAGTCAADLNGDGTVDGADLGVLLAAWGTDGSADLDESGEVDGADLGVLLAAWGEC